MMDMITWVDWALFMFACSSLACAVVFYLYCDRYKRILDATCMFILLTTKTKHGTSDSASK